MADIIIPIESNLSSTTPLVLGDYISKFVGIALILAAIVAFGYLILSGIFWITAGGDEKKVEEAKNRITGAIIGLAIVAASWALFLVIDSFFGLGIAGKSTGSNSAKNSYSSTANSGSNSGNTVAGISFVCITTDTCNKYCPNQDYVTVRNPAMNCGAGKVGCACVNKTNPKVSPCPTASGLTCN